VFLDVYVAKICDAGCGSVKKQNTSTSRKQETNRFASENNLEPRGFPESTRVLESPRKKSSRIHEKNNKQKSTFL